MSETIDYRPVLNGEVADPGPDGGSVEMLRLFDNAARDGSPVATAGPAVRIADGLYRFTVLGNLPPGRYWTEVDWRPTLEALPLTDVGDRLDLPFLPDVVVSPEDVATRLGLALPISAALRESLLDAIRDAQADVIAYIHQPITTQRRTFEAVLPIFGADTLTPAAWPHIQRLVDDKITVLSAVADVDGTFTLTVDVGLDGRSTPAITRFVTAHAAEMVRRDPQFAQQIQRRVSSVSAEGQSVTYDNDSVAEGAPGRLPPLKTLAGFKRHGAYRRPVADRSPWPYAQGYPVYLG